MLCSISFTFISFNDKKFCCFPFYSFLLFFLLFFGFYQIVKCIQPSIGIVRPWMANCQQM
ncbi:hypothetical protein K450DRAFT_236537 [Umbelopsis ramanniana AG]|uniref:Uncharacterized protein n=1 Tax=Umbelopsis ramanniana AG TaxID=1314678 RepID=A0AAD5EC88_UMBRA|nr:uncharacterized protein K450DRAFT_236537 [Umbelopsis ramanniana AG]KAI8580632.1 hypothetical protein K450DRAFT_236537 [Umbelopsis ramanniana AG]